MKSIGDTLKLVDGLVVKLKKENKVWIALIGGYAIIAHGVERTTLDVDFCIYNDLSFPVLPRPYLIAMKLKAGSIKDDYDIVELYKLLNRAEKRKTHSLAKLIHKDKNLFRLLKPRQTSHSEDKDLLM